MHASQWTSRSSTLIVEQLHTKNLHIEIVGGNDLTIEHTLLKANSRHQYGERTDI